VDAVQRSRYDRTTLWRERLSQLHGEEPRICLVDWCIILEAWYLSPIRTRKRPCELSKEDVRTVLASIRRYKPQVKRPGRLKNAARRSFRIYIEKWIRIRHDLSREASERGPVALLPRVDQAVLLLLDWLHGLELRAFEGMPHELLGERRKHNLPINYLMHQYAAILAVNFKVGEYYRGIRVNFDPGHLMAHFPLPSPLLSWDKMFRWIAERYGWYYMFLSRACICHEAGGETQCMRHNSPRQLRL